jgi:hypothetical protein
MKTLKILGLASMAVFFAAVYVSAQTNSPRTVTNTELEKYRDARVKADEEYRRTYAERGLPSPEELDKIQAERDKRLTELSLKLREERLQKEYFEALKAANSRPDVIYVTPQNTYAAPGYGYYSYGFVGGGFITRRNRGGVRFRAASNVDLVRQQASMFPGATELIRERSGNFRGRPTTGRRR